MQLEANLGYVPFCTDDDITVFGVGPKEDATSSVMGIEERRLRDEAPLTEHRKPLRHCCWGRRGSPRFEYGFVKLCNGNNLMERPNLDIQGRRLSSVFPDRGKCAASDFSNDFALLVVSVERYIGPQLMPCRSLRVLESFTGYFPQTVSGQPEQGGKGDKKEREGGNRKLANFSVAHKFVHPLAVVPIAFGCVVFSLCLTAFGYSQIERGRWLGLVPLWSGVLLAGLGTFGIIIGPIWLSYALDFYEAIR